MKRTWIWISVLILVLAASGAGIWYFNQSKADISTCTTVAVFGDANFVTTDATACLGVGSYSSAQITAAGIGANPISSMKVATGYIATIYNQDNFLGKARELNQDVANLQDISIPGTFISWNDQIKSIKVVAAPACSASLYGSASYAGYKACLPVGDYTTADLTLKGLYGTDAMSSLKAPAGYMVTLYDADNFGGTSQTFIGDIDNLANMIMVNLGAVPKDWNDTTGSVKVAARNCFITVYDAASYNGNSVCLAVGDYTTADLDAKGINNDSISSIYVSTGYQATMYVDNNFAGNSEDLTASNASLGTISWNDKISSIKIVAASATTPTPTPSAATPAPTSTTTRSVTLTSNGEKAINITKGTTIPLSWDLVNLKPSTCTATPVSDWFRFTTTGQLSGRASVTPSVTTTYKLTCGTISDQVVVTIKTATVTPAPTVTVTATPIPTPTAVADASTSTSSSGSTSGVSGTDSTGSKSAKTGPETPLVAGGLLSLIFGAYYFVKRIE